jgi:predicted DsbA family dithiol-disulfide isomerase
VRYTYFPLHPETPTEGRLLTSLFAGREAGLEEMTRRLRVLMAKEGLEYGDRTHTYNSRLAQELAVAGDAAGVTDALHDALFAAYFVDARNLASPEVLMEIARKVGLDEAEARRAIEERAYRSEVDEHWRRARMLGVTGVPTFVVGGFGVVGAQPYEALEGLLLRAGAARRNDLDTPPGTGD